MPKERMRYVRAMSSSAARGRRLFSLQSKRLYRAPGSRRPFERLTMGAAGSVDSARQRLRGVTAWAAQPPSDSVRCTVAVLGGQTVTNTGTSTILGTSASVRNSDHRFPPCFGPSEPSMRPTLWLPKPERSHNGVPRCAADTVHRRSADSVDRRWHRACTKKPPSP